MANLWYISDTHFGHANILKFTWRPPCDCYPWEGIHTVDCRNRSEVRIRPEFSSVEEMDEAMVENWNRVVGPYDHVYHLGDVVMNPKGLSIVRRLNGKLRLILGNHDQAPVQKYTEVGFQKIFGSRLVDNMLLTHIPVHQTNLGRFPVNLHGHIHQNPSPHGPYINLSVEVIGYTPVAHEEIKQRVRAMGITV